MQFQYPQENRHNINPYNNDPSFQAIMNRAPQYQEFGLSPQNFQYPPQQHYPQVHQSQKKGVQEPISSQIYDSYYKNYPRQSHHQAQLSQILAQQQQGNAVDKSFPKNQFFMEPQSPIMTPKQVQHSQIFPYTMQSPGYPQYSSRPQYEAQLAQQQQIQAQQHYRNEVYKSFLQNQYNEQNQSLQQQQILPPTPQKAQEIKQNFNRWFNQPDPQTIEPKPQEQEPNFEQIILQKKRNYWAFLQHVDQFPVDKQVKLFAKLIIEQILIDCELEHYKKLASHEVSASQIFNFFDSRKRQKISFNELTQGLQNFGINVDKIWIDRLIHRYALIDQDQFQNFSYGEFVSMIYPTNQTHYNLWNSVNNYNQQFNDPTKQNIQKIFQRLIDIERSFDSYKQLLEPETIYEDLFKLFMGLDEQQKGYINIQDFVKFMNNFEADFNEQEFFGIIKRFSSCNSVRISFQEFYDKLSMADIQPIDIKKISPVKILKTEEDIQLKEQNFPGFKKYELKSKK